MNKIALMLLALIVTVGCTSMADVRRAYVGQDIDNIVSVSGPPAQTYPMHGGGMIYVYPVSGQSCYSNGYGYTGCSNGCNLAFEVDESGRVRNVTPQGEDCGWHFSE